MAPDVRELKVRISTLDEQTKARFDATQHQLNARFDAMQSQINSLARQSEAQFQALLAAIQQGKAESELSNYRAFASLSERVAVLEARKQ